MNVAPEAEKDFNAWYDEEHLPVALARVPLPGATDPGRLLQARIATSRSTISNRRNDSEQRPGWPPSIRRGAPDYARISAIGSAF